MNAKQGTPPPCLLFAAGVYWRAKFCTGERGRGFKVSSRESFLFEKKDLWIRKATSNVPWHKRCAGNDGVVEAFGYA